MATLISPAKLAANAVGMITAIVTDLQAINGAGADTATIDINLTPSAVPGSYTGTLIQLVSRLTNRVLAAIGIADWDIAIPTTLVAAAAHYTADGAHSIYKGTGSPEGVKTAAAGSWYRDLANGKLYRKDSGSGNTGWVREGGMTIKSIQRGTVTLANGSLTGTVTITAVDVAKSELRLLGMSSTAVTGNNPTHDEIGRIALTNTTTITATRQDINGARILGWELTEFE